MNNNLGTGINNLVEEVKKPSHPFKLYEGEPAKLNKDYYVDKSGNLSWNGNSGSSSQEIGSAYDKLSKIYGVDFNDLIYGDKGFMKEQYPNGFPDFKGDLIYNDKYWGEMENWAKQKGLNLKDIEKALIGSATNEQRFDTW